MSAGEPVSVSILDREYLIACTPDERPGLIAAASFLDAKMREIRGGARSANLDRIAVLAALTIAHDLLGASSASRAMPHSWHIICKRSTQSLNA